MSMKSCNYGNNLKILLFIGIVLIILLVLLNFINNNTNTISVKENYYDIKNDYINLMNQKKSQGKTDNSVILSNYMEKSKKYQYNLTELENKITSVEKQLYLLKNGNDANLYTVKPSNKYQYVNSMTHYS
jgi:hypothetical protein